MMFKNAVAVDARGVLGAASEDRESLSAENAVE